MRRSRSWCAAGFALAVVLLPRSAAAQDPELDALLLLPREVVEGGDLSTRSLQFYRVPIGFTVRDPEQRGWGLRLTMPVSFGFYEARAATDFEDLLERLQAVTVTPGAEVLLRAGPRWEVKPFVEIGLARASTGSNETLFATGLRAAGRYEIRNTSLTIGTAARYASDRSSHIGVEDYTTLELGLDAQVPLGFAVGSRRTRGGVYGIARVFPGLDFENTPLEGVDVGMLYEVGLSFSTDPALEAWKIRLPWIALGYRFGDLFSGVRISLSFPF